MYSMMDLKFRKSSEKGTFSKRAMYGMYSLRMLKYGKNQEKVCYSTPKLKYLFRVAFTCQYKLKIFI